MAWEQAPAQAFAPSAALLIGLAVTGVFATGAFAVQMWAQQLIPAQQVALIFASEPAYAAWLSWYFLGRDTGSAGLDWKRIDPDGGADRRLCVTPASTAVAAATEPA